MPPAIARPLLSAIVLVTVVLEVAAVALVVGVNLLGDGMREWLSARKTADE